MGKKGLKTMAENDLIANLDKLHTTALGAERIRKNLSLDTDDPAKWCKLKIATATDIIRKGKNWYASVDGCVITVNAGNFSIITAHKGDQSK